MTLPALPLISVFLTRTHAHTHLQQLQPSGHNLLSPSLWLHVHFRRHCCTLLKTQAAGSFSASMHTNVVWCMYVCISRWDNAHVNWSIYWIWTQIRLRIANPATVFNKVECFCPANRGIYLFLIHFYTIRKSQTHKTCVVKPKFTSTSSCIRTMPK